MQHRALSCSTYAVPTMTSIEQIAKYDGVFAVLAIHGETVDVAGVAEHHALLTRACGLLDLPVHGAEEATRSLRLHVHDLVVMVERGPDGWILASVSVTGHKIGKSLPRMLRGVAAALTKTKRAKALVWHGARVERVGDTAAKFKPNRRLTERDGLDLG